MAVSTFQQTDSSTQPLTVWAADLDGNVRVLTRLGDMFAPHQQATPNMTVALDPGHVFDGTTLTEVPAQNSATITAPTGNPRIDRVVVDQFTGAISAVTGTAAASPVPPAIPAGKMPVAQVLLQTSSTAITNAMITDERDFSFLGGGITGVTAGTGLTGGGTAGNVTISLAIPVSVADGGTGATSAGPTAANNIGALAEANNLSDLANAGTARTNLGLGSIATQNANAVAITGGTITGLPAPTNPSDAATKAYVDATAQGLSVRNSVSAATAGVLPNSPIYSNGSGGVGATLTAGSNGALAIDGYTVSTNDRLLVKDQTAGLQNGLYTVTNTGSGSAPYVLTRATDANSSANLVSGIFTFVEQGTTNTGAGFVLTTPNPITVGTTAITFTQFSGAGEITAGTGLSKSGNTISLNPAGTGTIGGVQAFAPVAHQWINSISTSGIPAASQPAFTDISGQATLTQLPSIANNTVLGNNSGSTGTPAVLSASDVLNMLGTSQGSVLYRGASNWTVLAPGTAGQVLQTQGAGANPQWANGISAVTAGTGLTGGGTSGAITISLAIPVTVANGGTGATSAGPTAANNIGALAEANNLSDLANAGTARTNLGLGSIATQNANAVSITGGTITGLPAPTNPSDAATKAYVDATAQGLSVRNSVSAATAGALPNSPTYSNGTGGVGATLTAGSNGALAIDGYTVSTNDRLLIKDQAAGLQNGLYTVTNTGSGSAPYVLTRATDANSSANLVSGIFTFVEQGTANTGAGFVLTTPNPITVGTTALTFTQFSGAGEITAGTGLSKSGNTISLNPAGTGAIGGVQAFAPVSHQWINSISTSGIPAASQPAFGDVSGQAALAQLPSIANNTVLGNNSGSTGTPAALGASDVLNMLGTAQGSVLYRGASNWTVLTPGTAGQVLQTQGTGANPQWANGISAVTAGTGLTGGGTSGAITISLAIPVTVADGGTGATAAGPTAANNIGALAEANNLSDLTNAGTARTNLGLGSMATENANAVSITGGTITGLPTPTNASDAATKAYVDATAQGLSVRASVNAATAGALPNSPTYSNGTGGVGATLTAGSNGALTVDGYTVSTNDRLLIKDQAAGLQNGLYTVTNTGSGSAAYVLTRATDANSAANLVSGIFTFTERGTTNSGAGFVLTTPNPITVGTTALTFTQFSGAGEITAGNGLSKSGNTISLTIPVTVANGGTGATAAGPTAANNIGALAEANNLSDLGNAATARTNLGLGSAAVKNASGSGPTVASVSGTIAAGHFAVFADTAGTVQDGGLPLIALGGTYVNSSGTVSPGLYYVDTTAGPVTLTVSSTLAGGYTFVDAGNYWGVNNLTVNGGSNPIGNIPSNTASTFLANVSDYQFSMVADATYWRLV